MLSVNFGIKCNLFWLIEKKKDYFKLNSLEILYNDDYKTEYI